MTSVSQMWAAKEAVELRNVQVFEIYIFYGSTVKLALSKTTVSLLAKKKPQLVRRGSGSTSVASKEKEGPNLGLTKLYHLWQPVLPAPPSLTVIG